MISTVPFGKDGISSVIRNIVGSIDENIVIDFVSPRFYDTLANAHKLFQLKRNRFVNYFFSLIKIMKQGNYCAVHVHGNSSTMFLELLAAYLAKIRVRISHSHSSNCNHKIVNFILRPFFNCLSTVKIACGTKSGEWLYKNKRFLIVNNFINLSLFEYDNAKRKTIRNKYGLNEDDIVLLHVGRFDDNKNQSFVVKLLKNKQYKRKVTVFFIGDGEKINAVKDIVKNERIDNVYFLGEICNVCDFYSASDIFLLPSKFEGFPLTLVEAQASGLKCLVSDTVSDEVDLTGLVSFFSTDCPAKWIETIDNYNQKTPRGDISLNSQTLLRKEGFDSAKEIEQLVAIYSERCKGDFDEKVV